MYESTHSQQSSSFKIPCLKFSQKEEGHVTHDCLGNRKAGARYLSFQKVGKQNAIGRISTSPRRIEMMNPGTG